MRDEAGAVCCDIFEEVEGGIRGLLSVDEDGVDDEFPGTFYASTSALRPGSRSTRTDA